MATTCRGEMNCHDVQRGPGAAPALNPLIFAIRDGDGICCLTFL